MTDVRPLRWVDIPVVYRLIEQGAHFDAQLHLTMGSNGLRQALLSGIGRTNFYIIRHAEGQALGQLHFPADTLHAHLAYISPTPEMGGSDDALLALLDGLAIQAGKRGMTSVSAEVPESSDMIQILRQADFAVYARQDLWKRDPAPVEEETTITVRPSTPEDEFSLQGLYSGLVPTMIQQVEVPPLHADDVYVIEQDDCALCGMVAVYRGLLRKLLIEVYLHPEIHDRSHAVIRSVLARLPADTYTVYYRLRRYMGWLDHALVDSGFQVIESQAVMTRHTAVRITQPTFKPLTVNGNMSTIAESRQYRDENV